MKLILIHNISHKLRILCDTVNAQLFCRGSYRRIGSHKLNHRNKHSGVLVKTSHKTFSLILSDLAEIIEYDACSNLILLNSAVSHHKFNRIIGYTYVRRDSVSAYRGLNPVCLLTGGIIHINILGISILKYNRHTPVGCHAYPDNRKNRIY